MANIFDQFDKQQAQKNVFDQFDPDVTTDMAKGFGYGANVGIDDMLNVIGSPIRVPVNEAARLMGYEGELIPQIEAAQRFNVAGPAETEAGRYAQATGEVAGASAIPFGGALKAGKELGTRAPQMIQQMARNPGKATAIEATSTGGAGTGVGYAREEDLGPAGEVALGLAGGLLTPNMANIAARAYGGVRSGAKYANSQVQRARNPEQAAFRDVADAGEKAGFDFQAVRDRVAPTPSAQLRSRNTPAGRPFNEDDMADIVSRRLSGETAKNIGRDYGINEKTVQKYVDDFQDANPTPMNMIDIAKDELGTGGATPLTNQARADMAIADDPVAAQRLISRQRGQPGRTADIIEQSGIEGRSLNEELDRLATIGKAEERAAYKAVADNAAPINLADVIGAARKVALRRGGKIGDQLNAAVDLFFRKVAQPKRISAMDDLRMKEMRDRIAKAEGAENPDPDTIARLKRRFDAMRDDFEYNQNTKPEIIKLGSPVDDVRSFIDARDELSLMTQQSMKDGKSTMLTAELTKLRKKLNAAARTTNKELEDADAKYSGNRSVERMIERGGDLGKKLTPKTKKALRDFNKLTPTQQEIQRVAFEDKMAADALNVKRGNAAADQFQSDAFDIIVEQMYPKSAGKEIYQRGQNLLRKLRGEAITTETTRDLLSGSRTAPMQDDIAELMEGPRAATNLATGRFSKVVEDLSNRLARQIGQRAARERIRIVTETDPAKMLPMLVRLAKEAKTSGERRAYAAAIRQFKAAGRRPATEIGTLVSAGEED